MLSSNKLYAYSTMWNLYIYSFGYSDKKNQHLIEF